MLGTYLKTLRDSAGKSQDEAITYLHGAGVHCVRQSLSKYERGLVKNVPLDVLVALAVFYEAGPEHLLKVAAGLEEIPND